MICCRHIAVFACSVAMFVSAATNFVAAEQRVSSITNGTEETLSITPGPEITLAEALAKAETGNLTLSAMRQEIEKSEALYSKSVGMILPTARASLGYTHLDHAGEVDMSGIMGAAPQALQIDPLVTQRQNTLTGAISIRQSLVNAGAWYGVKSARKGADLAALSVEEMRLELSLSVARAYLFALTSFNLSTLEERLLASAEEHLRIARNRFDAGAGVRLDILRARSDLEDARQRLADARLAFDTARDALGVLIGMDGLPLPKEVTLPPPPELDDETLIDSALSERTDIAVENKRIELAELQKKSAWTALLPELTAKWQGTALFTDAPDMGDPDKERWSIMLSLDVPLFNWATYADIRHKKAAHRQAVIHKENSELSARKEIRQARREYLTALHNVETAARQVEVTEEALALTIKAFKAGSGSSLEVTDARKNIAAAEVNLITSRLQAQSALLSLLHAAGEDIAAVVK